ncbi:hypothetical protein A5695_12970 [Mycobacterium sp. E1747]|nr:hypothetical protein A5695_12970 [Mycobacterium sp. E1747]
MAVRTTAAGGFPGSQRAVSPTNPSPSAPRTGAESVGVFGGGGLDGGGDGAWAVRAGGGPPPVNADTSATISPAITSTTAAPVATSGARPPKGREGVAGSGSTTGYGL